MQDWENERICLFLKVNWLHKPQVFFLFYIHSVSDLLYLRFKPHTVHMQEVKDNTGFKEDLTDMLPLSLNYQHAVNSMLNERSEWVNKYASCSALTFTMTRSLNFLEHLPESMWRENERRKKNLRGRHGAVVRCVVMPRKWWVLSR